MDREEIPSDMNAKLHNATQSDHCRPWCNVNRCLAGMRIAVSKMMWRLNPSGRLLLWSSTNLAQSLMLLWLTRDIPVKIAASQMHRSMHLDPIECRCWAQVALAAHLPSTSNAFPLFQGRVSTCLQHCLCRLHPWPCQCPCASRAHSKSAIAAKPVTSTPTA